METIAVEKAKIKVGELLPEAVKHHIKKYVSGTDYGYVAHINKISQSAVDKVFRNKKPVVVTENTYPAVVALAEMALNRLEDEKKDAEVSKETLKAILKK